MYRFYFCYLYCTDFYTHELMNTQDEKPYDCDTYRLQIKFIIQVIKDVQAMNNATQAT